MRGLPVTLCPLSHRTCTVTPSGISTLGFTKPLITVSGGQVSEEKYQDYSARGIGLWSPCIRTILLEIMDCEKSMKCEFGPPINSRITLHSGADALVIIRL